MKKHHEFQYVIRTLDSVRSGNTEEYLVAYRVKRSAMIHAQYLASRLREKILIERVKVVGGKEVSADAFINVLPDGQMGIYCERSQNYKHLRVANRSTR